MNTAMPWRGLTGAIRDTRSMIDYDPSHIQALLARHKKLPEKYQAYVEAYVEKAYLALVTALVVAEQIAADQTKKPTTVASNVKRNHLKIIAG